jgi:hypothetical protein
VNITQIEKQFYHLLSEEDIRGGKISFRDTETGNTVLIWVRNDDVARDLLPNRPANILHVVVAIVANDSLEDTHLISPEQFMQHAPPERHAELADIRGFDSHFFSIKISTRWSAMIKNSLLQGIDLGRQLGVGSAREAPSIYPCSLLFFERPRSLIALVHRGKILPFPSEPEAELPAMCPE